MRPPESWSRARVTLAIAGVIAVAWMAITFLGLFIRAAATFGFIPARVAHGVAAGIWVAPIWLTPLTTTLVHGGFLHVAFILLMLAICGRPTEAVVGPIGIAILFLLGAYAGAGAYYLVKPDQIGPWLGAGSSVAAVLGAYSVLFGRNRVKIANPRLARWLNALWMLAAWVGINVAIAFPNTGPGLAAIAAANLAGFLLGAALANPLLLIRYRKA